LNKKYPELEFSHDDNKTQYVALETTTEVLADRDFRIVYVSDNRIVGLNRHRGDVFIFNREGRVVSFFNNKGNSGIEYINVRSIVFDEVNKEIFIADHSSRNRCVVYTEDGKFLRQLRFPTGSQITDLYNFDDQTLLAYNEVRIKTSGWVTKGIEEINQKMPYVFLSKKDGDEVSRVNLSLSKRISYYHMLGVENYTPRGVFVNTPNTNVKYGREFIIHDRSSDTVFLLTQDKKMTPLFTTTPSVFKDTKKIVFKYVHFKTDRYLFLMTMKYNVHKAVEVYEKGQNVSSVVRTDFFVVDLQTDEIFTPVGSHPVGREIDAPENTFVQFYFVGHLVDRLDNGKLEDGSELKRIAQALKEKKEEVNPIVEIIKY